MAVLSPLCQLKGGCMGCCGHSFTSAIHIRQAINDNTKEFQERKPKTETEFLSFRDCYEAMDLHHGVCRNLVQEKGCFHCPLHPARHNDKDLRINHCDVDYLCPTARSFATWDKKRQDHFLQFIEKQDVDNVTYSIKMDNGEMLKEFTAKDI
ncbi:TPA: hypothetical protein HA241_07170 [Candidatus Woesearchaeota archaeon]|nr:hypothetical protein [Candidatus Woesearchaeota archaeon]